MTYAVILWIGIMVGFVVGWVVKARLQKLAGVIVVTLDPLNEKTLFSLELFDDPETLISERQVVFKVKTSEEL